MARGRRSAMEELQVSEKEQSRALAMHRAAIYQIHVCGGLDEKWSDRLAGFQITNKVGSNGEVETILVGRVSDQAMRCSQV